MSITKFNAPRFDFIPEDNFEYKNLDELFKANGEHEVYRVNGLYINTKGKFGDSPVALGDNFYINLPSYLLRDVKTILETDDLIDDINNGKVGFEIYEYYHEMYRRNLHGINWIDLD